jgi:hypothetical protein
VDERLNENRYPLQDVLIRNSEIDARVADATKIRLRKLNSFLWTSIEKAARE